MNQIYLPQLKKIIISNFDLYPNVENGKFEYNFVDGVNLIIGGNGTGKTTFINIIKFALIGLYKEEYDYSRTYKGQMRERRIPYNHHFFYNIMENKNENATVDLHFTIRKTQFIIRRSLYDSTVVKVRIREDNVSVDLVGKTIRQDRFDKLNNNKTKEDERILEKVLQYKYENKVAEVSNYKDFDDFIFFTNKVLCFDESRSLILWNYELQEKLISKYFINPELNKKKELFLSKKKYYDSLSRHMSEDMRPLKSIIEELNIDNKLNEANTIIELKTKLDKMKAAIEKNKMLLNKERNNLRTLLADKSALSNDINKLERKKHATTTKIYGKLANSTNPRYDDFKKLTVHSKLCPMCNKAIKGDLYLNDDIHCFFCKQPLDNDSKELDTDVSKISDEINKLQDKFAGKEKAILIIEDEIYDAERTADETSIALDKLRQRLNEMSATQNKDDTRDETTKRIMIQIAKLEKERDKYKIDSKVCEEKADKIIASMDKQLIECTQIISELFSSYAGSFLGANSKLSYQQNDYNQKLYIPVINQLPRQNEEELSESQRFFIDQSFRMSILQHFYTSPSYMICETPDSSLDISYEENAADIYLKFSNMPNSLIITSNLNNSSFLRFLIKNAKKVNYINLLRVGSQTNVQSQSEHLIKISEEIEELINERS